MSTLALLAASLWATPAGAQAGPHEGPSTVSLSVPLGAPLRLYLTGRVSKRIGASAQARLMEPVFAFDREVIPAGTIAHGKVSRTQPVAKWERIRAILNGDFTPLRRAQVEFTTLKSPDGRQLDTHTVESMGLNSIYIEPSARKKNQKAQPQNPNEGILGTAKQKAKERIRGAIDARRR